MKNIVCAVFIGVLSACSGIVFGEMAMYNKYKNVIDPEMDKRNGSEISKSADGDLKGAALAISTPGWND